MGLVLILALRFFPKGIIEEEKNLLFKSFKLIYPTEKEVKMNIRSRSAKMRVIEKL